MENIQKGALVPIEFSDPTFFYLITNPDLFAIPGTSNTATNWGKIAKYIWFGGSAVVVLYLAIANAVFAANLNKTRRKINMNNYPLPVYENGAVLTPCLFGLFRPAIYLTPEALADDALLHHVLEHEMTHWRHKDHIWSFLRCVCLALHWYNPLVWLAAFFSKEDAELSCDETTLGRLGEERRAEYGRTILSLTSVKHSADKLFVTATTMTGSKKSIKERVTLIAKRPKTNSAAILTLSDLFKDNVDYSPGIDIVSF